MIKNYFKIAMRSLSRKLGYTVINILGLAIGMAACIMMVAYIQNELTYDRFHSKGDQIHRITYEYETDGTSDKGVQVPFPLKHVLLEEFPEVEKVVRFYSNSSLNNFPILQHEDNQFTENGFYFVDPEVFSIFDFQLATGDTSTALIKTESVVITKEAAQRYFGDQDPLGKTITYQNRAQLTVTGILEDFPKNSHLKFDFLAPVELQRQEWMHGAGNNGYDFEKDWKWMGAWTYIVLNEQSDIDHFDQKIQDLHSRFSDVDKDLTYHTQPFSDIYFDRGLRGEMHIGGNMTQLYAFGAIATLILLIACINFMNLTTALSTQHAREVGLRKVMGAHRKNLILQFLGEALIISFIATLLAGFLAELSIPYFNYLTGKELDITYFNDALVISLMLGSAIVVGVISGAYPAFVLSAFKPVSTLKGRLSQSKGGQLRKVLVVGQFVVSILLITGILVIDRQLDFIRSTDLGFDKEHIIVVKNGGSISKNAEVFRDQLLAESEILKYYYGQIPAFSIWGNTFNVEGHEGDVTLGINHVGLNFTDMFSLQLISGRTFPQEQHPDSLSSVLVNESMINIFGWSAEEAVGKNISYVGGSDNNTYYNLIIIGVTKDANFKSLHSKTGPIVFQPANWGDIALKVAPGATSKAIAKAEELWKTLNPEWPFEYSFLDKDIDDQYQQEAKLAETIQYFTLLAIFIACSGMLGLVSFTTLQRAREVSIRKVLGASIFTLVTLMTRGYFKLVIVAFIIAIMPAYWLAEKWLQDYAYKVSLTYDIFAIAGLITLMIALITVSYHSIKVSLINPVNNLRNE